MTAPGPVFFDMNDPVELDPAWKRCWRGQEPLWKVFWGWFFFGHGIILGCSVGFMVLAMVFGFVTSPRSLDAGIAGMAAGAVLLVLAVVPYGVWSAVSVWRCANNCINKFWGYLVRLVVIVYAATILVPLAKLV